jgi:hypothetical protein
MDSDILTNGKGVGNYKISLFGRAAICWTLFSSVADRIG